MTTRGGDTAVQEAVRRLLDRAPAEERAALAAALLASIKLVLERAPTGDKAVEAVRVRAMLAAAFAQALQPR
ncbi:hypothetical protein ACQW02_26005 [Humitalea sp. 24SJ18S-53]|uniref:hypothetical protein n=1 Tax=Humitalea sp. 24SJ18S-53 TaxID=3422307 RepID=UPI003D67E90B